LDLKNPPINFIYKMNSEKENLKKKLDLYEKKFAKVWVNLLERNWPIIKKSKGHRKETTGIERISEIKKEISEILNPIVIAEFLKIYGELGDHVLSYKNVDKGILILYRLLSGLPQSEMGIAQTNFSCIYNEIFDPLFKKNKKKITNKLISWADNWISLFSNINVRILHSHLYNPELFKSVTLMMDSKDFLSIFHECSGNIEYNISGKSNLISRKNNWKNAAKLCFMIDSRGMLVKLSESEGANGCYDSNFYEKMQIIDIIDPKDILSCDHHFDSGFKQMDEKYPEKLNHSNYCPNIKKPKGRELTDDQKEYKIEHSGSK
jgi:hypothetical protein